MKEPRSKVKRVLPPPEQPEAEGKHSLPFEMGGKFIKSLTEQSPITDSFYIVPSPNQSLNSIPSTGNTKISRSVPVNSPCSKTVEELTLENESLKTALDALALKHQKLREEQFKEKEVIRDSIADLGREMKREAAWGRRKTLADSEGKFQVSHLLIRHPDQKFLAVKRLAELEAEAKRIPELENELKKTKEELTTITAIAAKFKTRYEGLKDAIKKKRSAKEAELAAAAKGPAAEAIPTDPKHVKSDSVAEESANANE